MADDVIKTMAFYAKAVSLVSPMAGLLTFPFGDAPSRDYFMIPMVSCATFTEAHSCATVHDLHVVPYYPYLTDHRFCLTVQRYIHFYD